MAPSTPALGVKVTTPVLLTEYVPLPVIRTEVRLQPVVVPTAQSFTLPLSREVEGSGESLAVTSTVIGVRVLPDNVSAVAMGARITVVARVAFSC